MAVAICSTNKVHWLDLVDEQRTTKRLLEITLGGYCGRLTSTRRTFVDLGYRSRNSKIRQEMRVSSLDKRRSYSDLLLRARRRLTLRRHPIFSYIHHHHKASATTQIC